MGGATRNKSYEFTDILLKFKAQTLKFKAQKLKFKAVDTAEVWCPHSTCMVSTQHVSGVTKTQKSITLGMNGAAVPRHGLILSQDGATHSRKVSRYLPAPRDALKTSKTVANVKHLKNQTFENIYY